MHIMRLKSIQKYLWCVWVLVIAASCGDSDQNPAFTPDEDTAVEPEKYSSPAPEEDSHFDRDSDKEFDPSVTRTPQFTEQNPSQLGYLPGQLGDKGGAVGQGPVQGVIVGGKHGGKKEPSIAGSGYDTGSQGSGSSSGGSTSPGSSTYENNVLRRSQERLDRGVARDRCNGEFLQKLCVQRLLRLRPVLGPLFGEFPSKRNSTDPFFYSARLKIAKTGLNIRVLNSFGNTEGGSRRGYTFHIIDNRQLIDVVKSGNGIVDFSKAESRQLYHLRLYVHSRSGSSCKVTATLTDTEKQLFLVARYKGSASCYVT